MVEPDRTLYVEVREGLAFAAVPGDVAAALAAAAPDRVAAESAIEVAALVIVRLGAEAGEALLRHIVEHDPTIILNADPLFAHTLAQDPERIVGALAGTSPVEEVY